MEWVEVTGKTVEEATALALEQLGVAEEDADVEVLEEAKAGLFGRVRGEGRVRARVRPTSPRPKNERPGAVLRARLQPRRNAKRSRVRAPPARRRASPARKKSMR